MIKNYFRTAFRQLSRQKLFSFINILGLATGICAALVIFLIVEHEFSYDNLNKRDQVYRVVLDATFGGTVGHSAGVPAPLGNAVATELTGVELTVPVFQFQGDATAAVTIENFNKQQVIKKQKGIVFTNGQYFTLFGCSFVAGSPLVSLKNPYSTVLTEERAREYFPGLAPSATLGKQITYNNEITTTITGVIKPTNGNSSVTASELISVATIEKTNLQNTFMMNVWNDWMAYSQLYVRITSESNAAALSSHLTKIYQRYNPDKENNRISFRLQPLRDVHFDSSYSGVGQRVANKTSLYSLLIIAGFLLLLACINFVNLTTAQASKRAKEIGIRKSIGSSRQHLIIQFLAETFLTTLFATLLSFTLVPVLLNLFAAFIPNGVVFDPLHNYSIIVYAILLVVVVSLLSGTYPALLLSRFKPVRVLKNSAVMHQHDTRTSLVRKSLTVSQFVVAQFFVIATVMVSKQIHYSLNADLGFNKDGIITFDAPRDTGTLRNKTFLHQVRNLPEVQIAATGFLSPADKGVAFTNISAPGIKQPDIEVQIRWGTPEYLDVYKLSLLAGRNVFASDSIKEMLINKNYAQALGFSSTADAVGKTLLFNNKQCTIVGVLNDFHDQSMHAAIKPIAFGGNNGSTFHIRLKNNVEGGDWSAAIQKIEGLFKQHYPGEDFSCAFYDETIAAMYEREQNMATLLSWSTGTAILISCLGLFGLTIYTINSRTKEIGIRKVLGASLANITLLLSTDFIRLVTIAFLIAVPLAWVAVYNWLQDFVYRTTMDWWIFLLCGVAMFILAFLTLGFQTLRAAAANPVKNLRTE